MGAGDVKNALRYVMAIGRYGDAEIVILITSRKITHK
jgi:hypothetical protein